MKLTEFSIRRYGPLSDSGRIHLKNFNLFWGENEDGKTLTLEALIQLLLGRVKKLFPGIERVSEFPDGYVVVEMKDGHSHVLPEEGRITEICQLTPEIFANLFIIRNSNLSIARESEFYGDVTERLTGLQTTRIKKIKTALRTMGWFTEGMDTINTKGSNHLKRRVQLAENLLEETQSLLEEAVDAGYDSLEETLVKLQNEQQDLDREINELEKARLHQKYQRSMEQLHTIQQILPKLNSLELFTQEELATWKQNVVLIKEKESERQHLLEQYKIYEKELAEEEEKLNQHKIQLKEAEQRKEAVEKKISPLLHEWIAFRRDISRASSGKLFLQGSLLFFLLLSAGFLGALYWNANFNLMIAAGVSGTVTLLLALIYYYRFVRISSEMRELEQVILERGKSLGLRGNTVQELQSSINRLQEVVERHREQVSTIEERVSFLARTCKHLQEDRLKEVNQRIQQSREQIQQIEATRNLDDFEAYRKRLDEKMHLESRLQQAMAILRNYYGEEGDTLSQKVAYWQNRISELAEYQKVSQSIVFHEKELEKKKAQYGKIQAELEEIRKEMQQFQERLKAIEHKAAEVFIDEAPICRTVTDLENVHHRLKNFLQEIETRQERIRTAIQIFDEIEMEEKGKVGNLFGKNSAVSRLYDRVTRGLYQSVQYDPQENRILVERSDGSILSPEMLSGGAYDQLYFTIRIAFAEKLFPEEKGFFIFDDPFLKSDKERLQQELKLLLDFAQKGWQIIYFTAKDEIKEVLEPQIGSGDVVMHKVGGVLFKSERISR